MSRFKYTLPSGAEFVVDGPAGATQAQADKIFYEQVAAGALIGYESGQTLSATTTQLTTFELSRLDRGTAGVPGTDIIGPSNFDNYFSTKERETQAISQLSSIINGLPPELKTDFQAILTIAERLPIFSGIGTESILSIIQIATQESSIPTEIITPPDSVPSTVLNLPVISGYPTLTNVPLQNPINQADIVLVKTDSLEPDAVGTLTPFQVQVLLAQIINLVDQDYRTITNEKGLGKYGFTAVQLEKAGYLKPGTFTKYIKNTPENFVAVMNTPSVWTGLNGIYSLDDLLLSEQSQTQTQTELMKEGYSSLTAAGVIKPPKTASVNVSRGTVYANGGLQATSALTLLGAGSLATAVSAISKSAGGTAIANLLSTPITNLSTLASGAVNNLTNGFNNLNSLNFDSLSASLTNKVTGQVGALVANASKFGTQATALWSGASSLTGISNLVGVSNLNNITSSLTNLVPGSLTNLTSSLDVFGKASQFSMDFANPLSGLSTAGLNNLSSSLGSLTSNLTASISGAFGNLTGALGGLGNFGGVASLFGGGGDLVSGTQVAGGFNNTVNRQTVDAAFGRILGSNKIPLPVFSYPSASARGSRQDIEQAQNILISGGGFGGAISS
jgi:hypothetical protein